MASGEHHSTKVPASGPSRCDFCGEPSHAQHLAYWPCAPFELIVTQYQGKLYVVCACHTLALLPPSNVIVSRTNSDAWWAACPACRADIDAGRWEAIARRWARVSGPAYDDVTATAQGIVAEGTHYLFRQHAPVPGHASWQASPVTPDVR